MSESPEGPGLFTRLRPPEVEVALKKALDEKPDAAKKALRDLSMLFFEKTKVK